MKKCFALLLAGVFAAAAWGSEIVWNKEKLSQWKALRNVKTKFADGILTLYDIQKDPQVNGPVINIDPKKYNHVSITYRASGTPRSGGEFYFNHDLKSSIAHKMWRIPALRGDGKWHTLVLSDKALRDPDLWYNKGPVCRFRLDMTNAAGGTIEVSEIKLFYKKTAAAAPVKKVSKLPALPVPNTSDEPKWQPVKPEFSVLPMPKRVDPYFQGKMIKSPLDTRSANAPGSYYLRREFSLKAQPCRAWLQFNADDKAQAWLNGVHVLNNDNWRVPSLAEVSKELKPGKNVLGFFYQNARSAGGVMGELYVEYKDGSFERINTDDKFTTSLKADKNWSTVSGKCSSWQKVETLPGAPNAPWVVRLEYRDFSRSQHFVKASLLTKNNRAGEKVRFRFDFKGKMPALPFHVDIGLTTEGNDLYREVLLLTAKEVSKTGRDSWKIEADYALPLYMTSRKVQLSIKSGAIFCKSGGLPELTFDVKQVNVAPGYEKAPVARVVRQNGSPRISLNGKPFYMLWGGVTYRFRPDKNPRVNDAPMNAVTVYCETWWKDLDKLNTAAFDMAAEKYRRHGAKDAWYIWDLSIYPPAEFKEKFPDEMCRDDKGELNYDGRLNFSFASKVALQRMRWALAQAISYLERSPYANRIIGYRINSGHTVEWLGWDPKPNRTLDFSPASKAGFKAYAAKHYPQLKDTSIPSLAERRALDNGEILWDQKKHLKVIAYHDFYSNAVVDMMIALLRDARKLAGKNKLLGTYYGYVMTLHATGASQIRAHYATKRLLDSRTLDFLMSPQPYSVRQIGSFVGDMKPFRSMQNNNIIPVIEDDTRTHIGPYLTFSNNWQTHTEAHTIAVMRRNMGVALCRLEPSYFYALCNSGMAFDFPAMSRDSAVIRKVGEHTVSKARRNAEIAYVVSEEAIKSMPMLYKQAMALGSVKQRFMPDGKVNAYREGGVVFSTPSFQMNYTKLARLGAPADYLLAEDLKDNPGNYKLYIFINSCKFDAGLLKAAENLRKRNCTILWVYAPGYVSSHGNSVANMKRLTGLDFKKSALPLTPAVKFKSDNRWMGGFARRVAPMFALEKGRGVTPTAFYEDGSIGAGFKRTGKAVTYYCGTDAFDVKFLSDLAKGAGVHIYSENSDPIEANSNLLMLHARFAGKKTIKLPAATNVIDVFNKKLIGRNVKQFEFKAPLHSTFLFYYGNDAEELLKKLQKK